MRKDMFKIIVERPRRGVRGAQRVKARLDPLPERSKVGMKRAAMEQCAWTKDLNENLAPLRRYLERQCGRPWNAVYSEICARLDPRSTAKQHVRDHLEDLIVVKVLAGADGVLYGRPGRYGLEPLHESWKRLYVDPSEGIVKRIADLRRQRGLPVSRAARWEVSGRPKERVFLGRMRELSRIEGLWYFLRFERDPSQPREARVFDLLTRQSLWPGRRHAVEKRQLSGPELRSYGLRNLPGG